MGENTVLGASIVVSEGGRKSRVGQCCTDTSWLEMWQPLLVLRRQFKNYMYLCAHSVYVYVAVPGFNLWNTHCEGGNLTTVHTLVHTHLVHTHLGPSVLSNTYTKHKQNWFVLVSPEQNKWKLIPQNFSVMIPTVWQLCGPIPGKK